MEINTHNLLNYNWLIKYISILLITMLLSCADHKLTIKKSPNTTNKIRLDGFYYSIYRGKPVNYSIRFLYSNGTHLQCGWPSAEEFLDVENFVKKEAEYRRKDKVCWGLYTVQGNKIVVEGWNTSVGGGLPSYRSEGYLPNDTMIVFSQLTSNENMWAKPRPIRDTLFFRQFSPKPDSTNSFLN